MISASRIHICESSSVRAPAVLLSLDRTTRVVEWPAMSPGRTPLDNYVSGCHLKVLVNDEKIYGVGCLRERFIDVY